MFPCFENDLSLQKIFLLEMFKTAYFAQPTGEHSSNRVVSERGFSCVTHLQQFGNNRNQTLTEIGEGKEKGIKVEKTV